MKKIFALTILALIILPTIGVLAANDYTVLAPLPGIGDGGGTTTLQTYLPAIFNLLIGIAATAAVLNIVIGGFQYMTSDAINGKSAGKDRIQNALIAFVLILGAWIILYTVNPNLLNLNLNIETVNVGPSASGGGNLTTGGKMTNEQIAASNTIRESLASDGILTYRPACEAGGTTGCVNLNGLTQTTITGVEKLANDLCGGTKPCISITGGTEGGHSATGDHPQGKALDFAFSQPTNAKILPYLTSQLTNKTATSQMTSKGELITIKSTGVSFLKEGDHWHVAFP
jgi:hypothetical protein